MCFCQWLTLTVCVRLRPYCGAGIVIPWCFDVYCSTIFIQHSCFNGITIMERPEKHGITMVQWTKTMLNQYSTESLCCITCFCGQNQILHQQTQHVCVFKPRRPVHWDHQVLAWNGSICKHRGSLTNGHRSVTFPSAKPNRSHQAECLVWRPSCFMFVINELHLVPSVCNLWHRDCFCHSGVSAISRLHYLILSAASLHLLD